MPRTLTIAGAAAVTALLAAGCGGKHSAVSVRIEITSYAPSKTGKMESHTTSYSLRCRPTSGALPFAARICADIARHPQPLLDPLPARSVCAGGPFMPDVKVAATANGRTTTFEGNPDCDWPGGVGLAVYYDAATGHVQWLASTERRLRCDDDPTLLAMPTPRVSVFACTHNLWTPRTAMLIRIAKQAPAIRSFGARLFPDQIGDRRCTIPHGGPAPGGHFAGVCEVTVKKVWSTPTVTFTESWRINGRSWQSRARLTIEGGKVVRIEHLGADPPQLWS